MVGESAQAQKHSPTHKPRPCCAFSILPSFKGQTAFQRTVMDTKPIKEELEGSKDVQQRVKPSNNVNKGCGKEESSPGRGTPSPNSSPSTQEVDSLAKVKRLLSTLVQYGRELSPETSDRVRALVLALVGGGLSLEEFQNSLVEATGFPLRPFVLPFLRSSVPLLQKEIGAQARTLKQGVAEYLSTHESSVLDPTHVPGPSSEIFHQRCEPLKRRYQHDGYSEEDLVSAKRPLLVPVHPLTSGPVSEAGHHQPRGGSVEDQWRNIHVMLNCILSMVEKTKRALGMLQGGRAEEERRPGGGSAASDIMTQTIRLTEDRVAQVRRKAEEAVAEVKRQAVAELQKAVAAAESKASQLVAAERAKLDRLLRRPEELTEPHNSCWNCGRKAQETCSGCNTARYCGSFCQHKDWESHHQVCCPKSSAGKPSPNGKPL